MSKIKALIPQSLVGKIILIASLVAVVGALFFEGIGYLVHLFTGSNFGAMFESLFDGDIWDFFYYCAINNNALLYFIYAIALPVLGLLFFIGKKPVGKRSFIAAGAAVVALLYSWLAAFGGMITRFWVSLSYYYGNINILGNGGLDIFMRVILILTACLCTLGAAVAVFGAFKNARGKIFTIGMAVIGIGTLGCAGIVFIWDFIGLFGYFTFSSVWGLFCDIAMMFSVLVTFAGIILKRKLDDPTSPLLGE